MNARMETSAKSLGFSLDYASEKRPAANTCRSLGAQGCTGHKSYPRYHRSAFMATWSHQQI